MQREKIKIQNTISRVQYTAENPKHVPKLNSITKQPCTCKLSYAYRNKKCNCPGLLRLGKPDSVVTQVVDRVPFSQESITQDGKGSYRLREVHSHESTDTRTLNFKNVVIGTDGELVTGECERKVRKGVTLFAFNSVLSVPSLLGTNLLVQELG